MTSTSPTLTTAADDDLRALAAQHEAQAAAARAEVQRREAERVEAEAAAQRERDARLVLAHERMDAELVESGRLGEAAFTEAAHRGDYAAAFQAYVALTATRPARQQVRDRARAAEANAQTGVRVSDAELRYYPSSFMERLEQAAEQQAAVLGQRTAERLCTLAAQAWPEC